MKPESPQPWENITAFAAEATKLVRSRLSGFDWRGTVHVDDPEFEAESGRRTYTVHTDHWEWGQAVEMPDVPLETVRAATSEAARPSFHEGDPIGWDVLLELVADDAVDWELAAINLRKFLADVAASGGPDLTDAPWEPTAEPPYATTGEFFVVVNGDRLPVVMHSEPAGRESGEEVEVDDEPLDWDDAVAEFATVVAAALEAA